MKLTKFLSVTGLLLSINSANALFDCTASKCGSATNRDELSKIIGLCFNEIDHPTEKMIRKNPNCAKAFFEKQCVGNTTYSAVRNACTTINETLKLGKYPAGNDLAQPENKPSN